MLFDIRTTISQAKQPVEDRTSFLAELQRQYDLSPSGARRFLAELQLQGVAHKLPRGAPLFAQEHDAEFVSAFRARNTVLLYWLNQRASWMPAAIAAALRVDLDIVHVALKELGQRMTSRHDIDDAEEARLYEGWTKQQTLDTQIAIRRRRMRIQDLAINYGMRPALLRRCWRKHQVIPANARLRPPGDRPLEPTTDRAKQWRIEAQTFRTIRDAVRVWQIDPQAARSRLWYLRVKLPEARIQWSQTLPDDRNYTPAEAATIWGVTPVTARQRLRAIGRLHNPHDDWLRTLNEVGSIKAAAERWGISYAASHKRAMTCGWSPAKEVEERHDREQ